jgi:hypothetical protein
MLLFLEELIMNDFKELYIRLIVIFGIFILLVPIIYLAESYSCNQSAKNIGLLKGEYFFFTNQCVYTLTNGQKIDQNNYRQFETK